MKVENNASVVWGGQVRSSKSKKKSKKSYWTTFSEKVFIDTLPVAFSKYSSKGIKGEHAMLVKASLSK